MQIYTEELKSEKINELINSKYETDSLDFKENFDLEKINKSYLELIKDIVAFSNTEGGYIIYGVSDNFELVGLSEDVEIDSTKIDYFLDKYVDLNIRYVVSTFEYSSKRFQIIYIEKNKINRPAVFKIDGQYSDNANQKTKDVFKRGQVYIRKGTKSEPNLPYWYQMHSIKENIATKPDDNFVHNLPKPNYGEKFVGREKDLKTILDGLIEEEHTYRILVHGIGGLGKTALVQRVAYLLIEKVYNNEINLDYIFWVSAKNQEYWLKNITSITQELNNFTDLIESLISVLKIEIPEEQSFEEKIKNVRERFKEKHGLIIIDNWETINDENQEITNFLLRVPGNNKIIITSRHLIIDQQLKSVAPTPMIDQEGVSFLKRWRQNFGDQVLNSLGDITLKKIANASGGIPIAMIMALGQISLGKPIEEVIYELQEYEIDDPLLDFCFSETYKLLTSSEKKILLSLTFFNESVTKKIINAMTQINAREISDCLQRLTQFSFIDSISIDNQGLITQKYSINPITKSFLKKQLISVPKEKEFLEDNYQIISVELDNAKNLEIASMKSVIDKLEYITMEDKLAASFAASATRVWKTTQNWDEALRKFEKAKILSPNLGYIYGQWAWVCERAGKIKLARENYHKAVQLDEDNIKLWYQWAMFELLKGDFREAQEKFNVVLSKNPDDPRSWHGLGRVLYKKHEEGEDIDLDNIEKLFDRGFIKKANKITSERKHNSINAFYLAKINEDRGNYKKAKEYVSVGLRYSPQDFQLQKLRKELNIKQKNESEQNYKKPSIHRIGFIKKIFKHGAFVESNDGTVYFLHISKISNSYISDINQVLEVNQKVNFDIIKEQIENGKYPEIKLVE